MATKTLELELSCNIEPIPIQPGYDSYYILVRFKMRPLGWIWAYQKNDTCITVEQLQQALLNQLGWLIIQEAIASNLGMIPANNIEIKPISIVVCTRNRTSNLSGCLKALLALEYSAYEILIIDNAPSNDDTYQLLANMPVRYIREDRLGLDWARNRGIKEARYDIIAFTDDDAFVDKYWLQAIDKAFVNDKVMSVTGYVAPALLETPAQYSFEFGYGGMGHGFNRRLIKKDKLKNRQLLWASSFGVGANMAFRRDIFEKIGYFDIALDLGTPTFGGGDVEMFSRLVADGHILVYEPAMLVWHIHRKLTSDLRRQVYANGRSFGCYLITCYVKRRVRGITIARFLFIDWFMKWILKNFISPPKMLARHMPVVELIGMLTSPFAFISTQRRAKKLWKQLKIRIIL